MDQETSILRVRVIPAAAADGWDRAVLRREQLAVQDEEQILRK
jgi:hypothetical protein